MGVGAVVVLVALFTVISVVITNVVTRLASKSDSSGLSLFPLLSGRSGGEQYQECLGLTGC